MAGSLVAQVVAILAVGLPAALLLALALMLAVGGVIGCAEWVFSRIGLTKWAPGVERIPHRVMPAT